MVKQEAFTGSLEKQAKEIRYFFYSQAFADGLRATFAILIPALTGFYSGNFGIGLAISLGAMCVSLTDAPGPILQKANGMLFCTFFIFFVALITGVARMNVYSLALEIGLVSFLFSMLTVYGNRASAVGSAAILVMILSMDDVLLPGEIVTHALLILLGGIFYTMVSLLSYFIRPYRPAQRSLGDCIREIARFLHVKADFYDTRIPLDENYKAMIAQQVVVHEKQDAVREVFFKTRQFVRESTPEARRLVFTFVEAVDLFEEITAAYYDYSVLRKEFAATGALGVIGSFLKKMAEELDTIGVSIQSKTNFKTSFNYDTELKELKRKIDGLFQEKPGKTIVLTKLIVNIRRMLYGFNDIIRYFETDKIPEKIKADHSPFVSHQSLDPKIVIDNITLHSSVFRHAMRVSLACVAGFIIAKATGYAQYSYWILLTIAFILKPAYSLTKQRNIQRVIGTLAGGGVGVAILVFVSSSNIHFLFMVLFMIGTYSFLRVNYLLMVIFTTPYVLILFSFFGQGYEDVVEARIFDTLIGSAIAFSASYFLFPKWESEQLVKHVDGLLKANAAYLEKIVRMLCGQNTDITDYKLARKNVYVNSANLSGSFQRMLSEPRSKQPKAKEVHQFVVLNHILFSNTATITTTLFSKGERAYPQELVRLAKKAIAILHTAAQPPDKKNTEETHHAPPAETMNADEQLMKEQLQFITKICTDIAKTRIAIVSEGTGSG